MFRNCVVAFLFVSSCISQGWGKSRPKAFSDIVRQAEEGVAAVGVPITIPLVGVAQPGSQNPPHFSATIGESIGTAFFVSDDYLLTAAHVVRAAKNEVLYLTLFAQPGGKIFSEIVPVPFETVKIDDRFDVAVLHMIRKPTPGPGVEALIRPFQLAVGDLPPGERVAVTGYGAGANFPLTLTGFTASHGSMEFDLALRLLQRAQPYFGDQSSIFVIDRPIPGGISGSPVYLCESGIAYGIAVAVKKDPNSGAPAMSLAHPLERARELLDKHAVKYTLAAPLAPLQRP